MPSTDQFLAFSLASILLIEIPGPSLLFTIGRALSLGRRGALLSLLGNALGLGVQIVLVALGLSALVSASAAAHTVLTYGGALYVAWLGVQTIRHRSEARIALERGTHSDRMTPRKTLTSGMIVGATNPKTIVFFASFLPQFTDSDAALAPQILVLGLIFMVLAVLSDGIWALAASKARDWFTREPKRLDHLSAAGGAMMIGLGAFLALSSDTSTQ